MVAGLIQRSGPGGVVTSAGALIPERHRWETTKYGLRSGALQAGWCLADDSEKVAQLSGGWARIVWDLLRALRAAKLNPLESSLFSQSIEESWREPSLTGGEALPFRLNLMEISRDLECDRRRLGEALGKLMTMGLLVDTGECYLTINKDYRTWKAMDGTPLLSPRQVDWAIRIRKDKPARSARSLARRPARVARGEAPRIVSEAPRIVSEAHTSEVAPPDPHMGSAGAEEDLIQELRKNVSLGEPADRAGEWASERIARAYPGDWSLAEIIEISARSWVRDQGHTVEAVQVAIISAIEAGVRPRGFTVWVSKALANPKAPPRAENGHAPAAPRPNAFAEKMERQRLYIERLAREEAEREG